MTQTTILHTHAHTHAHTHVHTHMHTHAQCLPKWSYLEDTGLKWLQSLVDSPQREQLYCTLSQ